MLLGQSLTVLTTPSSARRRAILRRRGYRIERPCAVASPASDLAGRAARRVKANTWVSRTPESSKREDSATTTRSSSKQHTGVYAGPELLEATNQNAVREHEGRRVSNTWACAYAGPVCCPTTNTFEHVKCCSIPVPGINLVHKVTCNPLTS